MKIKSQLIDSGYWLGWNLLWRLPERFDRILFKQIANIAWKLRGKGVTQLELNLSRVLDVPPQDPKIRSLSKKTIQSYMRYYCETFLLPRWSSNQITESVRAVNSPPVMAAVKQGGVILTLPHSGNWDLAGAWAAKEFGALCTVAERLRPEGVFQKFLKMRLDRGLTIMPLTGEGGTYEFLKANLLSGKPVALVGDRDVGGNGMSNQFFGHRAVLPIGAAVLAVDTGLPLFTCSTWYDGKKLVIEFDDELEYSKEPVTGRDRLRKAQDITATIAKRFEKHISSHPENWHQLQPIWPDLVADQK